MNLSKFYGKNIHPACKYCLYYAADQTQPDTMKCEKGKNTENGSSCGAFRYEPTLREPAEQPLLKEFRPEDFRID
ncbi:MAG: hypothetical protein IJM51_04330 [Clostridia bacterium]|nr:hypothetical protein [Clostridia bacterium]